MAKSPIHAESWCRVQCSSHSVSPSPWKPHTKAYLCPSRAHCTALSLPPAAALGPGPRSRGRLTVREHSSVANKAAVWLDLGPAWSSVLGVPRGSPLPDPAPPPLAAGSCVCPRTSGTAAPTRVCLTTCWLEGAPLPPGALPQCPGPEAPPSAPVPPAWLMQDGSSEPVRPPPGGSWGRAACEERGDGAQKTGSSPTGPLPTGSALLSRTRSKDPGQEPPGWCQGWGLMGNPPSPSNRGARGPGLWGRGLRGSVSARLVWVCVCVHDALWAPGPAGLRPLQGPAAPTAEKEPSTRHPWGQCLGGRSPLRLVPKRKPGHGCRPPAAAALGLPQAGEGAQLQMCGDTRQEFWNLPGAPVAAEGVISCLGAGGGNSLLRRPQQPLCAPRPPGDPPTSTHALGQPPEDWQVPWAGSRAVLPGSLRQPRQDLWNDSWPHRP